MRREECRCDTWFFGWGLDFEGDGGFGF